MVFQDNNLVVKQKCSELCCFPIFIQVERTDTMMYFFRSDILFTSALDHLREKPFK